ncbi:T complex protein 1 theta subunit [Nosema bombycis CQ1]|uniref:T complex protein 1 theta subunit n=1 Tax=Nosema bombycis (strain CQ1 / CVCC 102059) TaxID=578461 RepID=R0KN94_NOSB1|nr:T complex protein 1 theta subunit [Nosema bombycis CQ1]|eukprot:EOB12136.1 T complex protein 1 theta subunit [Nosema bombycis CQ1]
MKKKISNLKSDVLIFSGRINEIYLDLLNKENKLIFKILSKHDLRRLRDLLGGSISQEFGEEVVKGKVKEIKVITLGNKKYTQFINYEGDNKDGGNEDDGNEDNVKAVNDDAFNKVPNNDNINNSISSKSLNVCSIILRHSLEYRLDDIERNLNKALIALQRNVKNEKLQVCPGKGQFEKRLGEIFFKLSKESLEKYNEGEDLLEKHLIYESLYKSMPTNEVKDDSIDIYSTKVKAICYALEFVGTVFEIEDYLIGIPPKLNVRPQMNQDWDEDH